MGKCDTILSKKEFTDIYLEKASHLTIIDSVTILDDISLDLYLSNGIKLKLDLTNAYNDYKLDVSELNDIIERYISSLESIEVEKKDFKDKILPKVKGKSFFEQVKEHLESSFVYKKINDELFIFYMIDDSLSLSSLTRKQFSSLNITKDSFYHLSVNNLENLHLNVELYKIDNHYMLTAGGNFEASLLLLDHIWTESLPIEGKVIVSVLTRNMVLLTEETNNIGLNEIKDVIKAEQGNLSYFITNKLFIYNEGTWKIYK